MTKQLVLSPTLSLPLETATRRLAILAMSGAGKSNVAVVMAEQMFAAGIPWVAIDPKGDWWGVRSSKDGKSPGLPVTIFGGLHGDIPLEPTAGQVIADTIVDQRLTCILDISEFPTRQLQWGFLIDLGETLLRRNREALHLFLEEADEYLPQRTSEKGNLPRCLGVWQRVVKRGRFRGIGSTQITQRNASLNKDTLYQAEALIAMRVGGKADREAVKGWVDHHAASGEIIASLPTLGDGEGWVSSPAWLRETKRVQFNRRTTFDSGATPVHLRGRATPATLADVDLDVLRTRMAETIEKAKADDPKLLQAKVRELEKRLSKTHFDQEQVGPIIRKEVDRHTAAYKREMQRLAGGVILELKKLGSLLEGAQSRLLSAADDLQRFVDAPVQAEALTVDNVIGAASKGFQEAKPALRKALHVETPFVGALKKASTERVVNDMPTGLAGRATVDGVSVGEQRVLDALAELRALGIHPATRDQVGIFAGYNLGGGRPAGYVGRLATEGYIETGNGVIKLTERGNAAANRAGAITSRRDLHQRVLVRLGDGERRLLEHLIAIYPDPISRVDLGAAVGYNLGGGRPAGYVGKLTSMGFADIPAPGQLVAGALLYPEGLR